jgi:hypothetical protein
VREVSVAKTFVADCGRGSVVCVLSIDYDAVVAELKKSVELLRDAGPGLHLCRPIRENSDLAEAWWKRRENLIIGLDDLGLTGLI